MIIETERTIIRYFKKEDFEDLYKLIGTVISGILRFFVVIRLFPRTTTFFQPEQLIQSEFFGNADPVEYNSSLFLPSTPDLRQCDKAQKYNSPMKQYKLRF